MPYTLLILHPMKLTKQSQRTTVPLEYLEKCHYQHPLMICRAIRRIMCPLLVMLRTFLLLHHRPPMVQDLILMNTCTSLRLPQALRTMFLSIIQEAATLYPTTGATLLPLPKQQHILMCLLNLPDLFFAPPPSTTLTLTPTPITPLCPLLRLSTLAPPPSTGRSPTPLSVPTSASCPSRPATSPRAPSPCSLAAPPRPPRSPIRSRCPPIRRRRSTSTRRCARSPWLLPSPSGSLPPRSRSRSYSSRSSR